MYTHRTEFLHYWFSKSPSCVLDSLYKTKRQNATDAIRELISTNFGMCLKTFFLWCCQDDVECK